MLNTKYLYIKIFILGVYCLKIYILDVYCLKISLKSV